MRPLRARPPMPWFNLAEMEERDGRSLHRSVLSLGEAGSPAPAFAALGEAPTRPFVVFAPPRMPGN